MATQRFHWREHKITVYIMVVSVNECVIPVTFR
jgi:hypothetical protein